MSNEIEITTKPGLLFDPTRIPIPKYKIDDVVFVVKSLTYNVHKVEVVGIDYVIQWFDNCYAARFICILTYELNNSDYRFDNVVEEDIFFNLEDASKESIKRKSESKIKQIEELQKLKFEAESSVKRYKSALEIALK